MEETLVTDTPTVAGKTSSGAQQPTYTYLPLILAFTACNEIYLEDDKFLISETDSYPKTSRKPLYLQIDVECYKLESTYLSANISHNNNYSCSLGFSQCVYSTTVNNF